MTASPSPTPPRTVAQLPADQALLTHVAEFARATRIFQAVDQQDLRVDCQAKNAGDTAHYRLTIDLSKVYVSLVTPGRYLSQSIEQDLVHTGDKLGDLLRDELIELGTVADRSANMPIVEHFRDPHKLYTFRTAIPTATNEPIDSPRNRQLITDYLLAYEAVFRHLGDMQAGDED